MPVGPRCAVTIDLSTSEANTSTSSRSDSESAQIASAARRSNPPHENTDSHREERPLLVAHELVGPIDGPAERLMVPCATRSALQEPEPVIKALEGCHPALASGLGRTRARLRAEGRRDDCRWPRSSHGQHRRVRRMRRLPLP